MSLFHAPGWRCLLQRLRWIPQETLIAWLHSSRRSICKVRSSNRCRACTGCLWGGSCCGCSCCWLLVRGCQEGQVDGKVLCRTASLSKYVWRPNNRILGIRCHSIVSENISKFLQTETLPSCLHCTHEYLNEWYGDGMAYLLNVSAICVTYTWVALGTNFSEELGLWGVMLRSHKFSCVVFSWSWA